MAATTPRKRKPKRSLDSMLDGARLAERSVELCLRGDLQADFEDLERCLTELRSADQRDTRLTSGAEGRALAEQIEALRAEMADSVVEFRLRALPKSKWSKLMRDHPGTESKQQFNVDTFVPAYLRLCIIDPELSDEQWVKLVGDDETDGVLSSAQYDLLADTGWQLNRQDAKVPFSQLASVLLRNSEPTLKQPTPSG